MAGSSPNPALLGLDWGTSNLRGFLMAGGEVLETRQSAHGIQHLPVPGAAGFEQALAELAGDWLRAWPGLPIAACGMVGSAQGWVEAPYVACPASVSALAARAGRVTAETGQPILIAPGLLFSPADAAPDVMRGEEIQIAGALARRTDWSARCCVVLPGTHCKWVQVEDGCIVRFATYLTGELFALLRTHSILGRLMPAEAADDANAFALGLDAARSSAAGDLPHQLFAARTLGLTGRLPRASLADYLSGLLIGHELISGLRQGGDAPGVPLVLIGEPQLCRRYASALARFGRPDVEVVGNTAAAGLWDFAVAAGLLTA